MPVDFISCVDWRWREIERFRSGSARDPCLRWGCEAPPLQLVCVAGGSGSGQTQELETRQGPRAGHSQIEPGEGWIVHTSYVGILHLSVLIPGNLSHPGTPNSASASSTPPPANPPPDSALWLPLQAGTSSACGPFPCSEPGTLLDPSGPWALKPITVPSPCHAFAFV